MKTYIEVDVDIDGYCHPGYAPITHRAPEDCDPGCPDEIEEFKCLLKAEGKPDIDITDYLTKEQRSQLEEELMDDYIDGLRYDNDMAYEASVGK